MPTTRPRPKVFCLGLSKTGTTSFGACMSTLGYRHLDGFRPDVADAFLRSDVGELDRLTDQYDSFDDWPWPALYERLAVRYPDAKFILTRRVDAETWLKSYRVHCESYFLRWKDLRRFNRGFFGVSCPHGQGRAHVEMYRQHIARVRAYFRSEPDRLLELCFETDPAWERLCAFLGIEPPTNQVPHENSRWDGTPWKRTLKRLGLEGVGRWDRLRGLTPVVPPTAPHPRARPG